MVTIDKKSQNIGKAYEIGIFHLRWVPQKQYRMDISIVCKSDMIKART